MFAAPRKPSTWWRRPTDAKTSAAGDEVLITAMEHHSNIVPWQLLCEEKGAKLRVAPINDRGELMLDEFEKLVGPKDKDCCRRPSFQCAGHDQSRVARSSAWRTRVIFLCWWMEHRPLRACQWMYRLWIAISTRFPGHKMYGPTGIGVLYGKTKLLEAMPPYQGGGDMIASVTFDKTIYNRLPYKFEAGTPNIADTIGLGAAIEYLNHLGLEQIEAHEADLLAYATRRWKRFPVFAGWHSARKGRRAFIRDGGDSSARYRHDS